MKKLMILLLILSIPAICHARSRGTWAQEDSVGTYELWDGTDTPSVGECVAVDSSDTEKFEYIACSSGSGDITAVGNCLGDTNGACFATTDTQAYTMYWEGDTDDLNEVSIQLAGDPQIDSDIQIPVDQPGTIAIFTGTFQSDDCVKAVVTGDTTTFTTQGASCTNPAGGDVTGPSLSTDNSIPRFHSTTGKIIQGVSSYNNGATDDTTIDDDGNMAVGGTVTATSFISSGTGLSVLDRGLTVNNDKDGTDSTYDFTAFTADGGKGLWVDASANLTEIQQSARVSDDTTLLFGDGSDWSVEYDEDGDDQLLIVTTGTAAVATTDSMIEILVGTTPTAEQQVFGVAKGTQSSNTELFTVDEDGDAVFAGNIKMGSGDSSIGFNNSVTSDPCTSGTGAFGNGVLYWSEGGFLCYCGGGADLLVSSNGACTY